MTRHSLQSTRSSRRRTTPTPTPGRHATATPSTAPSLTAQGLAVLAIVAGPLAASFPTAAIAAVVTALALSLLTAAIGHSGAPRTVRLPVLAVELTVRSVDE